MLLRVRLDADANDDPVVPEGEGLEQRLAATVVREQRIVVHATTPDVGTAPAAECVIHSENDRLMRGDVFQNELENAPTEFCWIPDRAREESIEDRVVLCLCCLEVARLDDARDGPSSGAQQPAAYERGEILE